MKPASQWLFASLFLFVTFQLPTSSLKAQDFIPDSLVAQRISNIETTLERDKQVTHRWWYGWLAAYSAATVVQGAIFFQSDDISTRQDMALGAATTILGAAGQFISPFKPQHDVNADAILSKNYDDPLAKLKVAEKLLADCAEKERLALTWQNHILCTAVNVGGGLVTWLGFKRTVWAGVGNFALNTVITETQIWSQPTLVKRKYKSYCKKYLNGDHILSDASTCNWYLEAKPGGIGIRVVF